MSEFFRTKHRHEQVGEQSDGDEPDEDRFHGRSGLEIVATLDIKPGKDEEADCGGEIDEVDHDAVIMRPRDTERELKGDRDASKTR